MSPWITPRVLELKDSFFGPLSKIVFSLVLQTLAPDVDMIIGEARSECSIAISRQTNHSVIPQISYASTSSLLSEKTKYPYFFRTCPSDTHQAKALSELVMRHDWQTLGTIAVEDQYSLDLIRHTEKELLANDVMLAAQERMIPRNYENVAGHLRKVSVELFSLAGHFHRCLVIRQSIQVLLSFSLQTICFVC